VAKRHWIPPSLVIESDCGEQSTRQIHVDDISLIAPAAHFVLWVLADVASFCFFELPNGHSRLSAPSPAVEQRATLPSALVIHIELLGLCSISR
jgi:hypothetical protein